MLGRGGYDRALFDRVVSMVGGTGRRGSGMRDPGSAVRPEGGTNRTISPASRRGSAHAAWALRRPPGTDSSLAPRTPHPASRIPDPGSAPRASARRYEEMLHHDRILRVR